MKKSYQGGDDRIAEYVYKVFRPEDEILREARERALREGLPEIQVGSMDGLHLEVIARASGARRAVEIGTLGGYSGICLLRGMGTGGKLYTLEVDPHHAAVARESFRRAGYSDRAEVVVGPALETLPSLVKHGPFDLVFIDADKESYPRYLEWAAENLRQGGVLLGDNTFAFGMIADETFDDAGDERAVRQLRAFNEAAARPVSAGGRFRATMLPTGEGLTFAVKI